MAPVLSKLYPASTYVLYTVTSIFKINIPASVPIHEILFTMQAILSLSTFLLWTICLRRVYPQLQNDSL